MGENSGDLGEALPRELSRLIDGGWVVAAYAILQSGAARQDVRDAAEQVLMLSGLPVQSPRHDVFLAAVTSQLKQIAGFGSGLASSWAEMDDDVLLTQGHASRLVADWIIDEIAPAVGLAERIRGPGAAFLDVGAGTGQLAAQIAARCPAARLVGLDSAERPLRLARGVIAAAGLDSRIELRLADVVDLKDEEAFDLIWVPVSFIAPPLLDTALAAIWRSLRPGGWVIAATNVCATDLPISRAVARLLTSLHGGTALTQEEAMQLLRQAGFADVRPLPASPVIGAIAGGCRPGATA